MRRPISTTDGKTEGQFRRLKRYLFLTSIDGDTLLHIACWQKHVGIAEYLILQGSDVDAKGCYGRTPLHYAVHEGNGATLPLCQLLLRNGADKNAKDDHGYTPLTWAAIECPPDMECAAEIDQLLR